jgi:hexulose-6-phosphate isomerase
MRAFPAEQDINRCLAVAKDAGFDAVEINLESGLAYDLTSSDADIARLRRSVENEGLLVSGLYSREQWRNPITSDDPATAKRGEEIVLRLAECAEIMGADSVLVVPGGVDVSLFSPGEPVVRYDVAYERAQTALGKLLAELSARSSPVVLCVENVWNKFLLSPLEMRRFVDELDSPAARVYFDVGNIMLYGFPEHWINILDNRIKRVHLKDFNRSVGTANGFTGLLQGDVNWPAVRDALVQTGYSTYLTAEVSPYPGHPFRSVRDAAAAIRDILNQ